MDPAINVYEFLSPVFYTPLAHLFEVVVVANLLCVLAALGLVHWRPKMFTRPKDPKKLDWGMVAFMALGALSLFVIPFLFLAGAFLFLALTHWLPRLMEAQKYARAGALVGAALLLAPGLAILPLATIHYTHTQSKNTSLHALEGAITEGADTSPFSAAFAQKHSPQATHHAYPALAQPAPGGLVHGTARALGQWAWRARHPDAPMPKIEPFAAGDVLVRVDAHIVRPGDDAATQATTWPMVYCRYRGNNLLDAYTIMGRVPNIPQADPLRAACPSRTGGIPATLALDDIFPKSPTPAQDKTDPAPSPAS